ncbi:MAG: hypothetical protein R3351_03020 [Nitrospirales bacterium]|nr:hypothetical protein [Nitrospirales bacterium]
MSQKPTISTLMTVSFLSIFILFICTTVYAVPVSQSRTQFNVVWCSAGISGVGGGSGTIDLDCVNGGLVKRAFLYWHGIDNSGIGAVYDNATVSLNGNAVTGTSLGDATTNCWGNGSSRAFEADVTPLIPGDGFYNITGLSALPGHNSNGASLVVIFDDGDNTNNRDLVFFTGNDSNVTEGFPGEDDGWHASLPGITYGGGPVGAQIHLADGQLFGSGFGDGDLEFSTINGTVRIVDDNTLYDGNSLPTAGTSRAIQGELWDRHTFDMTPAFGSIPGLVTLNVDGVGFSNPLPGSGPTDDCLGLVVLLLDLEPFSAPVEISLTPKESLNCTGEEHSVTATIKDTDGVPQEGLNVTFKITNGPNLGVTATFPTGADGTASWTYTDLALVAGTDQIEACFNDEGEEKCDTATKEWEVCNQPPDCSGAEPTRMCIWPPNHKFVDVGVIGVTDPDGDPVTIEITGITSDEATATIRGAGGVKHAPDATGVGSDTASVRAERSGLGDGRVYEFSFTAHDGNGGTCSGSVQVAVPHDVRGKSCDAVDSGQTVDATE